MKQSLALTTLLLFAIGLSACSRSSHVSTASSTMAPGSGSGSIVVPFGTTFRGKLKQEIDTKTSHDGDTFSIVARNGETVNGHLSNVRAAGIGKKPALTLVFDNVTMPDGSVGTPVVATIENIGTFNAKTHHLRTLGLMAAGAMAGHVAMRGKHHGGLAGAASGYVLSQEMKTDVDVKPGTTIVLKFRRNATTQ